MLPLGAGVATVVVAGAIGEGVLDGAGGWGVDDGACVAVGEMVVGTGVQVGDGVGGAGVGV